MAQVQVQAPDVVSPLQAVPGLQGAPGDDDDDVDSEVGDALISFDYAALEEAQRIAASLDNAVAGKEDDADRKRKQRGGCKESQKRRKRQRREDDVLRAKSAGIPVPSLKELLAAAASSSSTENGQNAASSGAASSNAPNLDPASAVASSKAASSADTAPCPDIAVAAESVSIGIDTVPDSDKSATTAKTETVKRRLAKEAARRTKIAASLNARTVFVTNLPFKATQQQISEWLSTCGKVKGVRMSKDKATSKPLGYAHVQFENTASVEEAIQKCDRFDVQGRVVRVARVGKGQKCQFELPQELQDDIVALIREAYEGKNISTIKDAWQKRHPGQKLDTKKYGFKNFSAAMRTIPGIKFEHQVGTKKDLTYLAFFTGSAAHTSFLEERAKRETAKTAEDAAKPPDTAESVGCPDVEERAKRDVAEAVSTAAPNL